MTARGLLLALVTTLAPGIVQALPAPVQGAVAEIRERQGGEAAPFAVVSVGEQRLYLFGGELGVKTYPVSTSAVGIGSEAGSNRTPLGLHRVARTFGDGQPRGMIFKARRPTGEIAEILEAPVDVPEDHVTTRVLWLEGLEPGRNKGTGVDSFRRYIYIHGTQEEGLVGRPASHGCVRMRNDDVIEVFDTLGRGSLVQIIR